MGQKTRRFRSGVRKMPAKMERPMMRRVLFWLAGLTSLIFVANLIYLLMRRK